MKLSMALLRKVVLEEAAKFGKMKEVEDAPEGKEVEADEYADTLEQKVDFLKASKVKEAKLKAALKKLAEQREKVRKSLIQDI